MRGFKGLAILLVVLSGCANPDNMYSVPSPVTETISKDPVSEKVGEEAGKKAEAECQKPLEPVTAGLHLLEPQEERALEIAGVAALLVNGKAIVNSSHSQAVRLNGLAYGKASPFHIVGGVDRNGSGDIIGRSGTNLAPVADPLRVLPPPALSSLKVQSESHLDIKNQSKTLSPGIYKGGIHLSSKANVKLLPGIYVVLGGAVKVDGASELSSTDAMIYVNPNEGAADGIGASHGGSRRSSKRDCDNADEDSSSSSYALKVVGGSLIKLSAPTSGGYKGVALFVDREEASKVEIAGIAGLKVRGLLYAPSSAVKVTGAAALDLRSAQLIGRELKVEALGLVVISGQVDLPASGCLE